MDRALYALGMLFATLLGLLNAVESTGSPRNEVVRRKPHPPGYCSVDASLPFVYCGYVRVLTAMDDVAVSNSPCPIEIVLVEESHPYDCRAGYDGVYDAAVYSSPVGGADDSPRTSELSESWLDAADLASRDLVSFFESLAPPVALPDHPFYDHRAAAAYAAAELAAAAEPMAVAHPPRFSAFICTLPDSSLADRLRPIFLALQRRGERALGLNHSALESPSIDWADYEGFMNAKAAPPSDSPSDSLVSMTADLLDSVARLADSASQQLRCISRPSVAKSHTDRPADATQR